MVIKKLILFKYKRFFLNNIDKIEYSPDSSTQIILGSNGSGKSSLFKELTPLPADIKKNYGEGGYKEIHIEHTGSIYILISGKDSPTKHNFIKDGIELNPGGTKKVQLELVLDHFKLNPKLVSILLSIDNFTTMSIQDRKEILSLCSKIDYTYALSVFLKIKNKNRDLLGGIKLLGEEIIKNESLQSSVDIHNKLKNDLKILTDFTNFLKTNIEQVLANDTDFFSVVKSLSSKLNATLTSLETNNVNTDDIDKNIAIYKSEMERIKERKPIIVSLLNKFDNVEHIGSRLEIENKIINIKKEISSIQSENILNLNLDDIDTIYTSFVKIKTDIVDEFSSIEDFDISRKLSKEERENYIAIYENLKNELKGLDYQIVICKRDMDNIKELLSEQSSITCPMCKHTWDPHNRKNNLTSLEKQLSILTDKYSLKLNEFNELEHIVSNINSYKEFISNIKKIINFNVVLKPIWEYFFKEINLNIDSSVKITTIFNKINSILQQNLRYITLKEELKQVEDNLKLLIEVEKVKLESNSNRKDELEKELENNTFRYNFLSIEIDKLNKTYSSYLELKKTRDKLLSTLRSSYINKEIKKIKNEYLYDIITKLEETINDLAYRITQIELASSKLKTDKERLEEYKHISDISSILEKELSPSEGLIAKSMNSFINKFISDMNKVINSIWSYPLELLNGSIDENLIDLNYKFKVRVNNDEEIEDISKLSSSMQEIVNLAFKIVLCHYMNLKDIPLYLDEFGSTFDSKHRIQAYRVIDKILSADFKQIFMICHYESLYGSMQNCDFNILNDENIEFNNSIEKNKNFIITYG